MSLTTQKKKKKKKKEKPVGPKSGSYLPNCKATTKWKQISLYTVRVTPLICVYIYC